MLTDEYHYKIIRLIEQNPEITQRELSSELGISLGKTNFCLKALVDKGILKAKNFQNSKNKKAYMYLLTPKGIEDKARVTARFLKRKMQEYEELKSEIASIQNEIQADNEK